MLIEYEGEYEGKAAGQQHSHILAVDTALGIHNQDSSRVSYIIKCTQLSY